MAKYDITRTIGLDTVTYPGDDPPWLDQTDSIANGDEFNASRLSLSPHCGTHLDAPAHFIEGGKTISDIPLDRFEIMAHVVDAGDADELGEALIGALNIQPGEAVLFSTKAAAFPRDRLVEEHPFISVELADALVKRGVGLVGVDYLSVERVGNHGYPVHKALLRADILILENADLRGITPGRYLLSCYPVKLHRIEAAPCRAILTSADML